MRANVRSKTPMKFHLPAMLAVISLATTQATGVITAQEPDAASQRPAEASTPSTNVADAELGEARLIRVRLPLVGNADQQIKSAIDRAVDALTARSGSGNQRRPVLILELAPPRMSADYGLGSDLERAASLARYLSRDLKLASVKTVAYVPKSIKGHGVLVAMACEEIVMDPRAEFGEAGADEDTSRSVEPVITSLYQQICRARRTIPEAIALGMLDPQLEVHKVDTEDATEFLLADQLERVRKSKTIVADDILIPTGAMGFFSGSEGRQYGFVKYLASDHDALARVLQLPSDAVVEDQSLVGDWRPVMINVEGPITPRVVGQVKTLIATEKDQRDVNWIGLRIDSSGGELADCLELANVLASQDPAELRTVAYVPVEASGGAALVALACDQVVLQPAAQLGGAGALADAESATPLDDATQTVLRRFALDAQQSWSLLAAMLDEQFEVFIYTNTKTGEIRYMSREEVGEQQDAAQWRKGPEITVDTGPLKLSSKRAQELGLAWQVVENFEEFKQLYGLSADPRVAEPNWALELVEALGSPALAVMLLVVGFIGIYIELHSPGLGVGGFIAAVAFMLFFWTKFLGGTAGWLEVLLFVGGLFFLLLEGFVLPGFGIFGLGGALMIVVSLLLASQTFLLPHSAADLGELRNSLGVLLVSGAVIIAVALALRRWLPEAPLLRTLLLNPPEDEELIDLDHRESVADYVHLVGQQGVATTQLMPAGKATIAGQLVDVIADGDIIERGQPIEVVSARGNRVLVRGVTG